MDAVHIHLMLNHVPVLGAVLGACLLLFAILKRDNQIRSLALGLLVFSAIVTIPVYLTGEPSEEVVEGMPGIVENVIERHEHFAVYGFAGIGIVGALSLLVLFFTRSTNTFPMRSSVLVMILSWVSFGLLAQTAYLGGQIRHSEINGAKAPVALPVEHGDTHEGDD